MPETQAVSQLELVRFISKKYDGKALMLGGSGEDELVAQSTERRARCPLHNRTSSDYAGLNEHGWVFRCGGFTPGQVKAFYRKHPGSRDQIVAGIWHFFAASPAR
jgi:hypothetical protein